VCEQLEKLILVPVIFERLSPRGSVLAYFLKNQTTKAMADENQWSIGLLVYLNQYSPLRATVTGINSDTHIVLLSFVHKTAQEGFCYAFDADQVGPQFRCDVGIVSEKHDAGVWKVTPQLPWPKKARGWMLPSFTWVSIEPVDQYHTEPCQMENYIRKRVSTHSTLL
jgi:hypothetical protein